MTKDDIMRMAREAGLHSAVLLRIYDDREAALCDSEIAELRKIERFANLVAEREREACADIVENAYTPDCGGWTAQGIADAIRARTTT